MNKEDIIIKTLENENQLLKENIKKQLNYNKELKNSINALITANENQREITNKVWEEKQAIEAHLNKIINSRSYKIYKKIFKK